MDILTAKETVVEAGKQLVKYGLIARTWGNVSCRISDTQFVITPSGKPYENLTADDIVTVNIADLEYEGDIKPSSEKGVHAECYKHRPDVNFVIHTHQMNASIVSALGADITGIEGRSAEIVGNELVLAGYGLPGTKTLRKGVIAALERTNSNAVIMAHHGAVCMGKDYEEAFAVANEVEIICEKYVLRKYKEVSGKVGESILDVADYISDMFRTGDVCEEIDKYDSKREGTVMTMMDKNGKDVATVNVMCGCAKGEVPAEAKLHMAVYNKRKDVNYIIHSDLGEVQAASAMGKTMKPLLDDFAQLAGPTVKCVKYATDCAKSLKQVQKALKGGRNAVMLKDNSALCCGPDEFNAQATEMVVEKNCKTYAGAELFGNVKPINAVESHLMNIVYRLKYSKQAK